MIRLLAVLCFLLGAPALALSPGALVAITSGGLTTSWNPVDAAAGITVSNNNWTAASDSGPSQSVRSITSKMTGRYCAAIKAPTISQDWDVGIADSAYSLTTAAGLGSDTHGIGFDPNSIGVNQNIVFNNVTLSGAAGIASSNGEIAMMCADFGAKLLWVTDSAMQGNSGAGSWNNTGGCDPTNPSCGLSFSGMNCPCFLAYNNINQVGVAVIATLRAQMPYALPPGWRAWDDVGGL